MADKVAVDGNSVLCLPQMHPIRLYVDWAFPFLQKKNIRRYARSGIRRKCRIRQTDGSEQFSSLRDISAHVGRCLVHCALGCDISNNTARTNLLQRFSEKIIMNQKIILVKLLVGNLVTTEGNIAYCQVEEIPALRFFKAADCDPRIGIKLPRNAPCNAVQFHAIKPAAAHVIRQHAEKIAYAAGRFQNITRAKPHFFNRVIHSANNRWRCVMRVERRAACRIVFLLCQQFFELPIFF